jgi:hypothetical protein
VAVDRLGGGGGGEGRCQSGEGPSHRVHRYARCIRGGWVTGSLCPGIFG